MNLDLIRAIDKWVGIPACFFVSLAYRILGRLKHWQPHEPLRSSALQKVLFIELSEMGSTILAYPAMKYLLRQNPGQKSTFLYLSKTAFQQRYSMSFPQIMS